MHGVAPGVRKSLRPDGRQLIETPRIPLPAGPRNGTGMFALAFCAFE
jgi:hypothetical protein